MINVGGIPPHLPRVIKHPKYCLAIILNKAFCNPPLFFIRFCFMTSKRQKLVSKELELWSGKHETCKSDVQPHAAICLRPASSRLSLKMVRKHIRDTCNAGDVPRRKILIEPICVIEHAIHISYRTSIPAWNICGKCWGAAKHVTHIGHFTRLPTYSKVILVPRTKRRAWQGSECEKRAALYMKRLR